MTLADLYCTLLVAGFHINKKEYDYSDVIKVGIERFCPDYDYRSIWRYKGVHPFDIGVVILEDKRVLVLYDDGTPNDTELDHHLVYDNPHAAWGFIRNFLEEHPQ